METLEFETTRNYQLLDITSEIEKCVADISVEEGLCLLFVPHATAAVMLEENEDGLKGDFVDFFKRLAEREDWKHDRIDNNASAHLLSGVIGQSRMLPISGGKLVRGTWQSIFFVELDGPRKVRTVCVLIVSKDGKEKR